jgi:hypothetical protein
MIAGRDEVDLNTLPDDELECISDYYHRHADYTAAAEALSILYSRSACGASSPPLVHKIPPKIAKMLEFLGLWHQKRGGGGG